MKITPVLGINGYKSLDGTLPIYLKVNVGQKRKLIPVDFKVRPDQWDEKSGRVKLKMHDNAAHINLKIVDMLNTIERNHLQGKEVDTGDRDDFYWWFDERLAFTKQRHSSYNYDKLVVVKNKLQAYAPALPVRKFDSTFVLRYEQHLAGLGNSANTIADNMMRLKIIVNMIMKSRRFPDYPNPFDNYVAKTTKVKKQRVKFEFIQQLEELPLDMYPQKELAVDMYLYSFFNAGIRFGDLTRIKIGQVADARLRYRMHKTTIDRNIKQMPGALRIFQKYSKGKKPSDYLFPLAVKWAKNPKDKEQVRIEDKSINSQNSLFNKYLKQVCRELDHPEVTFHTTRHSFADYTKEKKFGGKFDFHLLKDLLGHKNAKTTESYMKEFYEEESDVAMEQLFGSPAPKKKVRKK